MSNKVMLIFEENDYTVKFNETIIHKTTDCEGAIEAFRNEIKNNKALQGSSWENNEAKVRSLELTQVEISGEYQTITLGTMKYFHYTGKVFYIGSGKMIELIGGFEFFYTVLCLVKQEQLKDSEVLIALCSEIIEKNATYSLNEEMLSVASAAFSYGMVSYQFAHRKMNKGTASEQCSFETFSEFVRDRI